MKNSAKGSFAFRKQIYERENIIGVLNTTLLEEELQSGQDVLVVLVDKAFPHRKHRLQSRVMAETHLPTARPACLRKIPQSSLLQWTSREMRKREGRIQQWKMNVQRSPQMSQTVLWIQKVCKVYVGRDAYNMQNNK